MGTLEDPATTSVGKSPDNISSTIKYENFYSFFDDADIADCMLNLPDEECYLNLRNDTAAESPLDMQTSSEKQLDDEKLIARVHKHNELYFKKKLDGHTIACYSKDIENRDTT